VYYRRVVLAHRYRRACSVHYDCRRCAQLPASYCPQCNRQRRFHDFAGWSGFQLGNHHGWANRDLQSSIDARPRLCGQCLLRLHGRAFGCHLHRSQRPTHRRNSRFLRCDGDYDGEHNVRASAANAEGPPICLAASLVISGVLRTFRAASLCCQETTLKLNGGLASHCSASLSGNTEHLRSCGMWRCRRKRGPPKYSRAACHRHAARDVDHRTDSVGDDVNRHTSPRHPADSAHSHCAVNPGLRQSV
jgi:hypothetical protein